MNSFGWVAVAVVVVLVAGGAWWYVSKQAPAAPAGGTVLKEMPVPVNTVPDTTVAPAPKTVTVNYTDAGFSPASVTIAKGDTVTFTNSSSGGMWVASAMHPTHMVYAGTSLQEHCPAGTQTAFDQCQNGATYSFKFDKAGTWKYHNHTSASRFGEVIVVE